jgi:hypothetical protein
VILKGGDFVSAKIQGLNAGRSRESAQFEKSFQQETLNCTESPRASQDTLSTDFADYTDKNANRAGKERREQAFRVQSFRLRGSGGGNLKLEL